YLDYCPSLCLCASTFSFSSSRILPSLHSFPTRRSSDLVWATGCISSLIQSWTRFLTTILCALLSSAFCPRRRTQNCGQEPRPRLDRKSTRLNSSHVSISYAVFCLKKKKKKNQNTTYYQI